MSSQPPDLPPPLSDVRSRFATWRSERRRRTERIPPALWKAAARCAARFGIHRTARALGLDHASLKRRVVPEATPVRAARSRFVELVPSVGPLEPECVLELESRGGAKLRIELRGSAVPDIVELARRFGGEEP